MAIVVAGRFELLPSDSGAAAGRPLGYRPRVGTRRWLVAFAGCLACPHSLSSGPWAEPGAVGGPARKAEGCWRAPWPRCRLN